MINELEKNVIEWAGERGLLHSGNSNKQALKMVEEVGETCRAILKEDMPEIIDGIGDTIVTLIILANQFGTDIEHCLSSAYDVIKERKGRTIGGTFIKQEDLS